VSIQFRQIHHILINFIKCFSLGSSCKQHTSIATFNRVFRAWGFVVRSALNFLNITESEWLEKPFVKIQHDSLSLVVVNYWFFNYLLLLLYDCFFRCLLLFCILVAFVLANIFCIFLWLFLFGCEPFYLNLSDGFEKGSKLHLFWKPSKHFV
jgi:hypothetical protein